MSPLRCLLFSLILMAWMCAGFLTDQRVSVGSAMMIGLTAQHSYNRFVQVFVPVNTVLINVLAVEYDRVNVNHHTRMLLFEIIDCHDDPCELRDVAVT